VPVEFLTDEQAAGYAAYRGAPSRAELERFFFLDDADRELIEGKRRAHNRLGFAVQLCTVRYLGVFLDDPTDVPAEVADYLAEQLDVADPSVLKAYGERENTRLEHVRELRRVLEYKDFSEAEAVLRAWVDARAWTTGEGPKALFDAAAGWLGERRVLLPGVTTLARLVASVREVANQRLWDTLCGLLNVGQRAVLDSLLTVPPGQRISELDQLRRGPVRISGPQMKWALKRAEEIADLGVGEVDVSAIPPRRLAELSRYGLDGKASLLRRHGDPRRLATLLATVSYLTTRAVDDALDLLEVLIATKLLAPRLTVRSLPRQDPEQILDDTQRWALLRRCLTDETMPLDTRAAAALVLLFGLPLSRIRHLTVDQLELGGTRSFLATGRHPLLLPLRLVDLLQRLADTPPTRASLANANAQARQRWLFPGITPGRPTSRSGLQLKLCAYRVDARPARNGALISLAADLPAPVLADVLGLHTSTAVYWATLAKRDWSNYLAARIANASSEDSEGACQE
jgi:hypothetical protein